jgi:hypothetical protein
MRSSRSSTRASQSLRESLAVVWFIEAPSNFLLRSQIAIAIGEFVTSTTAAPSTASAPEVTTTLIAALQSELVGLKAEMGTKVATLEETIANLAHENAILKRRLFGNKTERSHTSEAQLAFGDLLAAEERLQKELDDAVANAKEGAGVAAG